MLSPFPASGTYQQNKTTMCRPRSQAEFAVRAADVIPATGTLTVAALQKSPYLADRVFVLVSDPVGAGWVISQPDWAATPLALCSSNTVERKIA